MAFPASHDALGSSYSYSRTDPQISQSLIHKSRSTPYFCQYRTNGCLFSMHFGLKLPEIGENRPDFGMSPTYGSDSQSFASCSSRSRECFYVAGIGWWQRFRIETVRKEPAASLGTGWRRYGPSRAQPRRRGPKPDQGFLRRLGNKGGPNVPNRLAERLADQVHLANLLKARRNAF